MTETAGSAGRATDVHRPPPRFWQDLGSVSAGLAGLGWAIWELTGRFPWGALGVVVACPVAVYWRARRDRARWPEQRAVDRALREHRDPGVEYRSAADQCSRERLVRRTTFETVVLALILGGTAVACLVVSVVREDPSAVLPGLALAALVISVTRRSWRERREAERWLADPPYPLDQERR